MSGAFAAPDEEEDDDDVNDEYNEEDDRWRGWRDIQNEYAQPVSMARPASFIVSTIAPTPDIEHPFPLCPETTQD
eukprot:5660005-Pyramimonas_sp.AAC.1